MVITYDRQEKTLFHNLSYPCTITLKKKTSWLRKIIRAFILLQYVVIFCFVYRGTSKSQEAVAFRRWFFKLSEIRSLVSKNVPFMAVTATATRKTKETIITVLRLSKFVEVSESPNKANISFGVQYMMKQNSLIQYFQWILDELMEKKGFNRKNNNLLPNSKTVFNLVFSFLKGNEQQDIC